jgi:hypothetical protein
VKASEIYGARYMTAEDFKGRKVTTVIEAVVEVQFGRSRNNREVKCCLQCQDLPRLLVLNHTNCAVLVENWGDEMDDWEGKPIVIDTHKVPLDGKMVDGIRIRPGKEVTDNGQAGTVTVSPANTEKKSGKK